MTFFFFGGGAFDSVQRANPNLVHCKSLVNYYKLGCALTLYVILPELLPIFPISFMHIHKHFCKTDAYLNMYGHIMACLVSPRGCSFVSKAVKAEEAGAFAVIVMDNDKDNDELYVEMVEDNTNRNPKIPAAFLLGRSG